jgi:hypothetical protein
MDDLRRTPATARLTSVLLFVLGVTVVGCGSGTAPTVAVQSPVETVYAFFKALNSGDVQLADVHLAPDSMLPRGGDAPPRDFFANLTCKPGSGADAGTSVTAVWAVVACQFDATQDWSGFSAGHYGWGVQLHRQPPGPWLVYDWGQG